MQFSVAVIATFALGAIAAPQNAGGVGSGIGGVGQGIGNGVGNFPAVPGDVTVGQAGDTCGSDLDLSCCDDVDQSGDSVNEASGLLAGALQGVLQDGELGLFSGCSKLNVAALIGLTDMLNSQCKQTPACCQHSGTSQDGLVNVGLPCVALGSVL
ncbi:hypothetical protein F4809DRAFT_316414 [Biscogniauxia mediterranea]|nr:hypothetical protein F4809DRAFT_316414 [Biscogniauxia mediterranea]